VWRPFKREVKEEVCTLCTQIFSLYFVRFIKEEKWTSHWYWLHFKAKFGWKWIEEQSSEILSQEQLARKEEAIFFRQRLVSTWMQWPWTVLKRDRTKDVYKAHKDAFRTWLDKEYPDVLFDGLDKKRLGISHIFSGMFLQVLMTAILAGLTRFRLGNASRAAWLLVWMYGAPILRYTWLNGHTMHRKPCLKPVKWLLFFIHSISHIVISVGVCGGTAVIGVELFGDLCNTTFSLTPGVWALVASCIAAFFLLIYLIVMGIPKLFGTPILTLVNV
jgi:hypothetical protein